MGQSPSRTTIFRHYKPPGGERSDIKNGTVPSDSSLTTKIFPLLRLSRPEIYYYDGSITTQLTNNIYDDYSPQISGNNVVWYSYGSDGSDLEIYYYNVSDT